MPNEVRKITNLQFDDGQPYEIGLGATERAELNAALANINTTIEDNEEIISTSLNDLNERKADKTQLPDTSSYFNDAEYDSQTNRINFKNGTTVKTYIDTTDIFDADDYYTKTEIDNDEKVISNALNELKSELNDLSTVATSGSYNDLSNRPTIPAAQVQSDWSQTTSSEIDYIKNKPTNVSSFTNDSGYITGNKMYVGTCSSAANTRNKVATVETFPTVTETVDNVEVTKPVTGTIVAVKFVNTNSYKTAGYVYTLNVNSTGAFPMYYAQSELATSSTANTQMAGYAGRYIYYMFDGTHWIYLSSSYDYNTNTTYTAMTQKEINNGTGTTGRTLTPELLRSNFYTEAEVDTLLSPLTPTSNVTENSTYPVTSGAVYSVIADTERVVATAINDLNTNKADKSVVNSLSYDKADKIALVNHGTSDTTFTLTPNTKHVWGEVSSLQLNFATEILGIVNIYYFQFDSGSTPTNLSLPAGIKWNYDETPVITPNTRFQISVEGGIASVGFASLT